MDWGCNKIAKPTDVAKSTTHDVVKRGDIRNGDTHDASRPERPTKISATKKKIVEGIVDNEHYAILQKGGEIVQLEICCLRAVGSSPAVWVFWRPIWRTESLDRGLILVCRFSFVSSRECIPVAAQARSCLQNWMHVRVNPLLLPNG
jgi:hypothetical protein